MTNVANDNLVGKRNGKFLFTFILNNMLTQIQIFLMTVDKNVAHDSGLDNVMSKDGQVEPLR